MMQRMNFSGKWIRWIDGCLTSVSVSVMVNCSPGEEFHMERGIRKGDPLAPFLFLLVAEGLTGLVRKAMATGKLKGFNVGRNDDLEVPVLQFVDDTLLMGEASLQNVFSFKCILRCYELASGLKVNFLKSCCVGIGVPVEEVQMFASILNCKIAYTRFTYLGLPIGENPRRTNLWQPMLNKLRKKRTSWKQKSLSFGGRLYLLNSILSAFPLFFLSFFRIPKGVLKEARKIMRNFLWGGSEGNSKVAWVKWEQVCRPKDFGGLGLKDWALFNTSLLGKWRWKLMQGNMDICSRVLRVRYGSRMQNGTFDVRARDSAWWKDVYKICFDPAESICWFNAGLSLKLGCGDAIRFWKDIWYGGTLMKTRFQKLFHLSL